MAQYSGTDPAQKWYSVKEAADHLGVSQPTIFRWMKDNLLSFYKVGGSTRFTLESLEAVIEKTTGRKEAEAAAGRCASCGHSVLVGGKMQGIGQLHFRPDKSKFWVFGEALVGVDARVCPACGFVQLYVDTPKLNRLLPEE